MSTTNKFDAKKALENLQISEKSGNIAGNREAIYNVPKGLSMEGRKKFRSKMRKTTDKHLYNIAFSAKQKDAEALKNAIDNFLDFYRKEFIRNDFSVASVRSRITNEADKQVYQIALAICKDFVGLDKDVKKLIASFK